MLHPFFAFLEKKQEGGRILFPFTVRAKSVCFVMIPNRAH